MIHHRCDGCGTDLPRDGSGHFIVRIEAFAAAGGLAVSEDDLRRDLRRETRETIERADAMSVDELEDGVYRALRYDLCAACHRRYLAQPLGGLGSASG